MALFLFSFVRDTCRERTAHLRQAHRQMAPSSESRAPRILDIRAEKLAERSVDLDAARALSAAVLASPFRGRRPETRRPEFGPRYGHQTCSSAGQAEGPIGVVRVPEGRMEGPESEQRRAADRMVAGPESSLDRRPIHEKPSYS
jgi:hypothetical protein